MEGWVTVLAGGGDASCTTGVGGESCCLLGRLIRGRLRRWTFGSESLANLLNSANSFCVIAVGRGLAGRGGGGALAVPVDTETGGELDIYHKNPLFCFF